MDIITYALCKNKISKYVDDRIIANPTETGTSDLTKLKVGDVVYNIVGGSGNLLNIENGERQDSITQKYTGIVDATHFGNTNTGESAAVFGESNENNANRVLMGGKLNRTSTKEGVQPAKESLIVGIGNGRGIHPTPEIDGIEGMSLIVAGSNNTNIKDDRVGAPNPDNAIVSGLNNVNKGREAIVSGYKVINLGMRSIVVGEQLINNYNYDYKAVFGKFNESKSDTLFEIGNGTDNARSNAFEVTNTGIARAYGTPMDANDLIPKGFADSTYALKTDVSAVYKFQGSVATYSALPSNLTQANAGWVYDVLDTGDNYAWTGTAWDKLAGTVDLSGYVQKTTEIAGIQINNGISASALMDSLFTITPVNIEE